MFASKLRTISGRSGLRGPALPFWGRPLRWFTVACRAPQAWSKALFEHPLHPDGIGFYARHDDEGLCYAIFDRARGSVREIERETNLDQVGSSSSRADTRWSLLQADGVRRALLQAEPALDADRPGYPLPADATGDDLSPPPNGTPRQERDSRDRSITAYRPLFSVSMRRYRLALTLAVSTQARPKAFTVSHSLSSARALTAARRSISAPKG
jgi:hypothetical protein